TKADGERGQFPQDSPSGPRTKSPATRDEDCRAWTHKIAVGDGRPDQCPLWPTSRNQVRHLNEVLEVPAPDIPSHPAIYEKCHSLIQSPRQRGRVASTRSHGCATSWPSC